MNTIKTNLRSGRIKTPCRSVLKARKQVREFFNQYFASEALALLLSACRAAESNTVWDQHNPSDLLQFINAIKKLLAVTFPLSEKELRLIGNGVEQLQAGGYHPSATKYLSLEEAADPALTLFKYSRVNSLAVLKSKLDLILEFALSRSNIAESGNKLAVLSTVELFAKIIESVALLTSNITD